jgi:hypothetical protein
MHCETATLMRRFPLPDIALLLHTPLITNERSKNMQLLQANTTNITTAAQENYSYLQTVFCFGTFNGATVALQGSPDGSEWFDIASFTAKQVIGIGLSVRFLRAAITNAGGTTSVSLIVV